MKLRVLSCQLATCTLIKHAQIGGYVIFPSVSDTCVQPDEANWAQLGANLGPTCADLAQLEA